MKEEEEFEVNINRFRNYERASPKKLIRYAVYSIIILALLYFGFEAVANFIAGSDEGIPVEVEV